MTYATQDDLEDRYGTRRLVDLTDRGDVATGAIDVDVITRAIADTAAVIDGYIAPRYVLPVTEVPPLLRDLALTIVFWKLHLNEPDQKVKDDYAQAMKTLEGIQQGRVRLPLAEGADAPGTGGTGARVTDRARPMEASKMKGFI